MDEKVGRERKAGFTTGGISMTHKMKAGENIISLFGCNADATSAFFRSVGVPASQGLLCYFKI